jgi:asparagine synthase (glutamine-hydrolysing)
MAVSLEARSPFLDYRIVEFALRLPLGQKFRDGEQKWILRKMLARHVPVSWLTRPKQGFDLPLSSWFRNELREELLDRLSPARIARYGFMNAEFVQQIITKHLSGRYDYYYMLWALLCFDRWYERHLEAGLRP